jgi:hypothetical protein
VGKRKAAGVYVKVFAEQRGNTKFYRDGYTDMTGSFRYALEDIDEVSAFAILVQTDRGGVIERVKAPTKLSAYRVMPTSKQQKSMKKSK